MNHREGTFRGHGGLELYYQCWRPEGTPLAVLVLIHGFGEHSGRYMNVVNHLVPRGYAIWSFDHRGHGRSPGRRGFVRTWDEFREDIRLFLEMVRQQEGGLPVFLMGHSMGGLMVLEYALHHPGRPAGRHRLRPGPGPGGRFPRFAQNRPADVPHLAQFHHGHRAGCHLYLP